MRSGGTQASCHLTGPEMNHIHHLRALVIVFGFVAPAALVWMTWRCVQIRSNQSATGILYVSLAFVLIGEIIAKYFLVSAHLIL